ncbi:hypothetical protein PR202_gb18887 [Eleusine coracana subsp. coracana]|uniref:STAS domain-containing protein n=1 Tax=Eleusine coracana subsp. coracana TaxID=191504 RepID=A0AAV5F6T4_ELECO|nr:hypothetical protein PR202_gb18887 [Eleusine coracana subsp. coracana]
METSAAVESSATMSAFEVSKRSETAKLVLNSPKPPSLREELVGTVGKAFRPRASSSGGRQPRWAWALTALQCVFPVMQWGRTYNLKAFKSDVMAGLTLASLGIPQSIGYANLAKLDPQYGLYTSVVPPLIYAVMGTSREIAIGPVAVVSLLLSSMIQNVVDPATDPVAYRSIVFTVTFLAGVFQVSFGLFRCVWHPGNFCIGCAFLIFILTTRFIGRRYKKLFWLAAISPLLSVILSTTAVYATRADKHGVKIIQSVHAGVNPSSAKQINLNGPHIAECAKIAIICAVIALTEAIAVGRSFASIRGFILPNSCELQRRGQVDSVKHHHVHYGVYRLRVVHEVPLLHTDGSVLASIILSALPGLIDIKEACNIWKVDKMDFLTCLGAFVGVLFGSVEIGLAVAQLAISFAKIIIQSLRPQVEILGRIQGTNIFCSIRQYPVACRIPTVQTIRIDTSFLCFINATFIKERVIEWVREEVETSVEKARERVQSVVIDMSNVVNIDTSGLTALEEIHKELVTLGIQMAIAGPGWQAVQKMKLAQVVDRLGEDWIFLTVGEAVEACLTAHKGAALEC